IRRGGALLPVHRLDPHVLPEPAREEVHVHVRAAPRARRARRAGSAFARREMSELYGHDLVKYYGDLEVLRGVTFQVEPGQVKVIVGPSGSGKSTLLRVLAGLEAPDRGTVTLEGRAAGP